MISPCCCGCAPSPGPVKRFVNATKVSNYPGSAGTIDPYARVYYTACSCSPDISECNGTGQPVCYTHGYDLTIPTNEWTVPGVFPPDATGGELVSQVIDNYFKHDGTTMLTYPSHCTYGWKAVLAKSIWQGRAGFIDSGVSCCNTGGQEQIKYRTISESAVCTVNDSWIRKNCSGSTTGTFQRNYSSNCNQTSSVDDYGNITRSGSVSIIKDYQDNGVPSGTNFNSCEVADGNSIIGYELFAGVQALHTESYPSTGITFDATCGTINWNGYSGTVEYLNGLNLYNPTAGFYAPNTPCSANTAYTELVQSDSAKAVFEITQTTLRVTFKHIGTYKQIPCCDTPGAETVEYIFNRTYVHTVTLSGEVAYSDVVADAESLLGEWDMTKDEILPWRHDTSVWLIPLVSRDAGLRAPTIDWGHVEGTCDFVNEIHFSGEIRGAPMPAGYGYYFNFYHRQWCAATSGAACNACETYLGEMGAAPLPYSATQWPEKPDGCDSRGHGAHLYNIVGGQFGSTTIPTPGDVVYAQKWAETLTKWPAINLARACGRDRYLYDETAFVCGSLSGTDLTLDTSATLSGKVVILDGVYEITGGSGTAYTVGSRLYDALVSCDGVAPLRFSTARAICSTLAATAVQTSAGLVTVTTTAAHWLKRGGSESDTVTFTGISGLTSASATVVDDTSFTVSGTLTTSPSTGTISDGATSAQITFDTTCSRNTFIARSWQSLFREAYESLDPEPASYSVTETQVTLAPTAKHPTVLYCTPNGEAFEHGYQIEWGSISADMCHGTAWSARFEQAIIDPFWQADHAPCGSGAWSQRLNPCEAADSEHYAFPPLVEPLISLPSGAPTPSVSFWTAGQAMPGAVGHSYCSVDPYEIGFPMSWRESWLTCETWKALIGFKC